MRRVGKTEALRRAIVVLLTGVVADRSDAFQAAGLRE